MSNYPGGIRPGYGEALQMITVDPEPMHHAILAIDMSLTDTGWCTSERTYGSIKTDAKHYADDVDRMMHIVEQLKDIAPANAAWWIEEGFTMGSMGDATKRLMELRGMLRMVVYPKRLIEIPPMTLKMFTTGKGHADKDMMIQAVQLWGYEVPTKTPKSKKYNDNIADSISVFEFAKAVYGEQPLPRGRVDYAIKWAQERGVIQ